MSKKIDEILENLSTSELEELVNNKTKTAIEKKLKKKLVEDYQKAKTICSNALKENGLSYRVIENHFIPKAKKNKTKIIQSNIQSNLETSNTSSS